VLQVTSETSRSDIAIEGHGALTLHRSCGSSATETDRFDVLVKDWISGDVDERTDAVRCNDT
jgi:hypothetical protein